MKPDIVTYNTIINAYARSGDVGGREKQIWSSGGSLEPPGPLLDPPGPLLTQLHTVYNIIL
jgi:hypothetical protein